MVFDELSFATLLAHGIRKATAMSVKNLSERVTDQENKDRLQGVLDKIQDGTEDILSALASMQKSRIYNAYYEIFLAIKELEPYLQQLRTFHENLNVPYLINIKEAKYYELAMNRFREAEKEARAALHDGKNTGCKAQIQALGIVLFCQIVLHPGDIKMWFSLWETVLRNSFFNDKNLVKAALGKPTSQANLFSPEYKETRKRMKNLIESLSALIFMIVVTYPSLVDDAVDFVKTFNHLVASCPLAELKKTNDWEPLKLGHLQGSITGASWFTNDLTRGAAGALLPSDGRFMYIIGLTQLTWVAPNLVFGVGLSGELISIDPAVASRNLTTTQGKWEILGYASETHLLYAIKDDKLSAYDIQTKSIKDQIESLPVSDTKASDYIFLVAADGSMLASNKNSDQRYVYFSGPDSAEWLVIDDSKHKNNLIFLKSGDQLLIRKNKPNYLVRLSLIISPDGKAHIQKEKIKIHNSILICEYTSFKIDVKFSYGVLTTNITRLSSEDNQAQKFIYIVGHSKESSSALSLVTTKPKVAKLEMKVNKNGSIKGFSNDKGYKWEAGAYPEWPAKIIKSVTYGDGTIFV